MIAHRASRNARRRPPTAGPARPPAVEPLEPRRHFAAQFPSDTTLEFQTNGPARAPGIGDWYTTATSASTERAHFALVDVTADMLTAGGGTVAITVNDAESATGPGPLDEVQGTPDPTRFRLLQADRATVVGSVVVPSGSANGTPAEFSVTTPGTYYVESVTGAGPISGDTTPDLNDDDNAYSITISQSGGLVGQYQATFQPNVPGDIDLYFVVGPGTTSLFLRNFDLDGATITYTRPNGTTTAGTGSASGLWNGPSPTLDTGGDTITGLTAADVGIWRARIASAGVGNQAIFEPNDGAGRRIVVLDTAPQAAGNFSIEPSGTLPASPGTPTDHPFAVTNNFATADVVNLSTAGTAAGFTAVLLNADGTPLTDTTGDGVPDTGLLAPGATASLILRVTPAPGASGVDVTTVNAVSFLDARVNGGAATTRTITRTTGITPAVADAVIDYGFLRSRNATLTGNIAAGDPGTHRVRINWGDGEVSYVDLADGQTAFAAGHRYTHGNRHRTVRITVTSGTTGLTSEPFTPLTRSQAAVVGAYRDALGRDPTAKELKRYSKKFDKCRSAESLDKQAAALRSKLAAQAVI